MTRNRWLIVVAAIAVGSSGCGLGGSETSQATEGSSSPSPKTENVRQPAVAGLFYPDEKEKLAGQVDRYLADVKPALVKNLRGIIAPHAGYEYSGPVAAVAYKQLEGRDVDTVVVMAPSHYADFEGASVPKVDAYGTPLGRVPLSPRAAQLAKVRPLVADPRCRVSRPGWSRQASKEPPPLGEDTPHTWEHSLEVQLPFLQRTLKDFAIVPIVFGSVDSREVANALQDTLDDKTVLVASSDLSHYYPYDVAQQLDSSCIRAICDLDVEWMKDEEACGKGPILTLMHLARENGWRAKLLDYRNSGDTSGDKSGVVGYAAIVFFEPEEGEASEEPAAAQLGPEQGKILLDLAAKTVTEVVEHGTQPAVDVSEMPEGLTQRRACFVTLTKQGELRGCIGSIFPREALCRAVIGRARSAATEDPRFPPVKPKELDDLEIEVSVLTIPKRLEFESPEDLLAKLRPGTDGVVFRIGPRQSTYLPQVWEELSDPQEFMGRLSQKAGLSADAWRSPEAMVLTYQVQAFEQSHE
jgi:AmmeMemoRadiSam system protein B/AmmeMemoRadiSam system protein A